MKRRFLSALANLVMLAGIHAQPQTLGEAARKEAERRKALEREGIDAKVIEYAGKADASAASKPSAETVPRGSRDHDRLRTGFQKLDRDIRQVEDRLDLLRRRLDTEKRVPPISSRITRGAGTTAAEEKLRREIDDLGLKLKRLQADRRDAYNAARKAGMLPGEIDGKGITP